MSPRAWRNGLLGGLVTWLLILLFAAGVTWVALLIAGVLGA